jgi:hypothetical protein
MTQQINNQDKQPADRQDHADPEHNESDRAVSPVINTHLLGSPCCSLLLSISSMMPEGCVMRNGISFNTVGDFLRQMDLKFVLSGWKHGLHLRGWIEDNAIRSLD